MDPGHQSLYQELLESRRKGKKKLAVLIDPDKSRFPDLAPFVDLAVRCRVDYCFVGGSLLSRADMDQCIQLLRQRSRIPVIIFPGSTYQLSEHADGILFLSLISGRNPELLIGQQVLAAPFLKRSSLEVLSTGYMLIDGGVPTSVQYMSNTMPIPADKNDIAVSTAMAGEMMGMKLLFMDAGSGARQPISPEMINAVRQNVGIPLIVGGGIRDAETVQENLRAGADVLVIGNAFEHDPSILIDISSTLHAHNVTLNV